MLARTGIRNKDEVCTVQFIIDVKKKIISSKNNPDSKKITILIDNILGKIFQDISRDYNKYSTVQRIQIRSVVIHLLVYNLKKVVCHQQLTQQMKLINRLTLVGEVEDAKMQMVE